MTLIHICIIITVASVSSQLLTTLHLKGGHVQNINIIYLNWQKTTSLKCKGVSSKKKPRASSSWEMVDWLRALGALHSPCLKGNEKDLKSHDKGCETHAHRECEHGIQFIVLHRLDYITSLSPHQSFVPGPHQ